MAKVLCRISNDARSVGNSYFKLGDYSSAIKSYTEAIEDKSTEPATLPLCYGNRSLCYLKLQDWDCALRDADLALSLDPKFMKAHWRRGESCLKLGRFSDALESFNNALALDTSNSESRGYVTEAELFVRCDQRKRDWLHQALQSLSTSELSSVLLFNAGVMRSEQFAKDVMSMSMDMGKFVRGTKLMQIDKLGRIVDTKNALDLNRLMQSGAPKPPVADRFLVYMYAMVQRSEAGMAAAQQFGYREYTADPSSQKMIPQTSQKLSSLQKLVLELSCAEASDINSNKHIQQLIPARKPSSASQ